MVVDGSYTCGGYSVKDRVESPCCTPESNVTLCVNYTLIKKNKNKIKGFPQNSKENLQLPPKQTNKKSNHTEKQCTRLPFPPHPLRHRLFLVFLTVIILTGVRCYLIVVLICISLTVIYVEHLFVCLLATYISSLEKNVYSGPLPIF